MTRALRFPASVALFAFAALGLALIVAPVIDLVLGAIIGEPWELLVSGGAS